MARYKYKDPDEKKHKLLINKRESKNLKFLLNAQMIKTIFMKILINTIQIKRQAFYFT